MLTDSMELDTDDFLLSSDGESTSYFNDDVKALTQSWINERCAPEILPYQEHLVNNLLEMLNAQAENVEAQEPNTPDGAFLLVIYQQEMERIKFVIRSYLRTRLAKIQKYTLHFLQEEEYRGRLSTDELAFAEKFQELLERHFMKSCLEELPAFLQRLDDEIGDISMVNRPELDDAVICRVKEDIGAFQLDDSDETTFMKANNVYILQYKAIRRLLEDNKVDLV
ncbi:DNA replication protein SLD5 [Spizellomyces punctatus DAOM BR117]|uniref:DNA replication complex GINS protein SLD5 n=1 Tax=Spizellomyces punctatus (strain DAOM BR117) TaxID=645134 RepID=A0A0L0HJJ7_SPIPD|nr:DNA replication protein SLD5 [Spizellomyces punctatus DAOM BR117]KND01198.1 hypothetical protein SPPG_04288 [Spizellomyces punctatus DAOM BR117]|eukprot:XP_016609237.1 hypothetical protein SPPG_04288 [Spizellomyces punctatus DAOM BR117]